MSDFDQPIAAIGRKRHRRAVTELVNRERTSRGMPRLRFARSLSLSARAWARALSSGSKFTHGDWARRVLRFPFVLASRGASSACSTSAGAAESPHIRAARRVDSV